MTRDFEADIKFNKYQLDEVCEKHASVYWYWANKLAEAKNALGDSEDKFKLTSAQREMFIRQHWDESWGKQTEAGVKAQLESDTDYKNKIEEKEGSASSKKVYNLLKILGLIATIGLSLWGTLLRDFGRRSDTHRRRQSD